MSSFLGDIVNSIGTNKVPSLPKNPAPPLPRPPTTSSAAHSNPIPKPKVVPNSGPTAPPLPPVAGLKRKLDERDSKASKAPERLIKPNPAPGLSSKLSQKPTLQQPNGTSSSAPRAPVKTESKSIPAVPKPASAKGSYAQMIARAKEAQQSRTQNPLGTIKHQATSKEKTSKLAERRRQEQEKLKSDKDKKIDKTAAKDRLDRKRGASPIKKKDQPKVPRAPRPPLHAPASSYKGTMGMSAKKPRDERIPRNSRYDEYLATDEEDNDDMDGYGDDDDGYGYGSDASSDMEAGLDDIDMEEAKALKAAKDDDAREAAFENELKREKEERKRRLQAMARKAR